MGPRCPVGYSENVTKYGPEDEPREVQDHGLQARLHMGEVGIAGLQERGDGRSINV